MRIECVGVLMTNKERIKKANDSVIAKMKRGESLTIIPADATWFPPRPIIEKSKKDLERLYGVKPEKIRIVDEAETD